MKNSLVLLVIGVFSLASCTGDPKTDEEKLTYYMGYNLGKGLSDQSLGKNVKHTHQGIKDGVSGKEPLVSQKEVREAFQNIQKAKQEKDKVIGKENKVKAEAFLAKNKAQEGVKVTASGLQYKVLKEGAGKKPKASNKVSVHYKGRLIDGTEFDSSYKRNAPAEFQLDRVIRGWSEGIPLMAEGAKYEFYVPPELGYGARSLEKIPANSVLIFEVELLKVLK